MICTFFGHRDSPPEIYPLLENLLTDLIKNNSKITFYVGNQGAFDNMAILALKNLKKTYPHIKYYVVLAYMPYKKDDYDYSDTLYPDGLENTPPKFAIFKRNNWLIEHSDTVITYISHTFGGAHKFKMSAIKQGKKVIELYNKNKLQ